MDMMSILRLMKSILPSIVNISSGRCLLRVIIATMISSMSVIAIISCMNLSLTVCMTINIMCISIVLPEFALWCL